MTRLQRLHVRGFRGIVDSALAFSGGSIILGGGNGTGKTAFVDAFEFLFRGSIAPLSGTAGLSLRQHATHILANSHNASVSATWEQPDGTITRRLSGAVDAPAALDRFLKRGGELVFILRRSQVQDFIHAKPADRYRSMADLIGADDLDRTQTVLKHTRDALEAACRQTQAQLDQVRQQRAHLPSDKGAVEDLLAHANEGIDYLGFPQYHLGSLDDVDEVRASVVQALAVRPDDRDMTAGQALAVELERGLGTDGVLAALEQYERVAGQKKDERTAQLVELLDVLRKGRDYVRATASDHCPLCRQHVDARSLLSQLARRVAELEEVNLQQQRLESVRDDLTVALQDVTDRMRSLSRAATEAGTEKTRLERLQNSAAMLRESIRIPGTAESLEMCARLRSELESFDTWSASIRSRFQATGDVSNEQQEVQRAHALLALLEDLRVRHAQAHRSQEERDRLEAEIDRLQHEIRPQERAVALADHIYVTFTRVKNEEMQRLYDALQEDLARLYDRLHPGEGHGVVSILMDPRKRGSSDLRMDFYRRRDEDPRAYASEGHLDSLGVCIFLAFVRRFNGDWPLLVLDDVVTSVDIQHKRRLADLLFDEFGDRQLFITTHDVRWFNELRRAQSQFGQGDDATSIAIERWSLEQGPELKVAGEINAQR